MPTEFEKMKPGRRSNIDQVWQLALNLLESQPNISCRGLRRLLIDRYPDQVAKGQRTSLQERLKAWRKERVDQLDAVDDRTNLNVSIFEEALHVVSQIQAN